MGKLRQTTEEIQDILDKVQNGEVGEKIVVDSMLSTESENPVMNKVITEELGKKVEASSGIIETIDNPRDYIDDIGENLYIPLSINDSAATKIIVYFQPNGESVGTLLLNQENNYVDEKWNESGDYCYHAEYANGILRLEEISNFSLDFIRVEVYDIKAIDESLIPNSIARKKEVEDATGRIEEHVDELREETTALWENLEHGTFPDLVAGDLAGHGESVPAEFTFRASGGKSIKDGRAYIKAIKGNSVVWNNASAVVEGGNAVLPQGARLIRGHKYLIIANRLDGYGMYVFTRKDSMNIEVSSALQKDNGIRFFTSEYDAMSTGVAGQENSLWWYVEGNYGQANLHDLTQMFGAGNEPSTIEEYEARKPIVEDEYAYNEGEVIHMTAEGIKSIGDNAWDEQWRQGFYYEGEYISRDTQICSKNPIQVLPNESYCINQEQYYVWYYDKEMQFIGFDVKFNSDTFVTPSNAAYIHFNLEPPYGATYKNDIMLTLVHSGWKQDTDAGYQPYWQDTLPLPIISKYFPNGMKKAGSAYDEVRFNKVTNKWEAVQRIGVLDNIGQYIRFYKGNINYDSEQSVNWMIDEIKNLVKIPSNNGVVGGLLCDKLIAKTANQTYSCNEGISIESNGEIAIHDSEYHLVGDMNAVKSKYADASLYYELAEPIVTEITEDFRDYYKVADFGTEQLISSMPSAPFSADIIYQFNAVDMIREHELEITELQKVIATMQAQLASLTNN